MEISGNPDFHESKLSEIQMLRNPMFSEIQIMFLIGRWGIQDVRKPEFEKSIILENKLYLTSRYSKVGVCRNRLFRITEFGTFRISEIYMFRNPSFHTSRASDIKISEIPNFKSPCLQRYIFLPSFQNSRNAGVQKWRISEIQLFRNPDFEKSTFPDIQIWRNADVLKCTLAEIQSFRKPAFEKSIFSEIQDSEIYHCCDSCLDQNRFEQNLWIKTLRFFQNPCW